MRFTRVTTWEVALGQEVLELGIGHDATRVEERVFRDEGSIHIGFLFGRFGAFGDRVDVGLDEQGILRRCIADHRGSVVRIDVVVIEIGRPGVVFAGHGFASQALVNHPLGHGLRLFSTQILP